MVETVPQAQAINRDARLTGQWSKLSDFSHDWPVSLTSCRFWADPFIASVACRDVTVTRTLTVDTPSCVSASFHVRMIQILNGIQCKRQLIMYLYVMPDEAYNSPGVSVWVSQLIQWPIHTDSQLNLFWNESAHLNESVEWINNDSLSKTDICCRLLVV